jgi:hypothetical protein
MRSTNTVADDARAGCYLVGRWSLSKKLLADQMLDNAALKAARRQQRRRGTERRKAVGKPARMARHNVAHDHHRAQPCGLAGCSIGLDGRWLIGQLSRASKRSGTKPLER